MCVCVCVCVYVCVYKRTSAREAYTSNGGQYLVGGMILAAFFASIVQAQVLPEEGSDQEHAFQILEYIFTGFFTLELLLNVFGHWFLPFVTRWPLIVLLVVCPRLH